MNFASKHFTTHFTIDLLSLMDSVLMIVESRLLCKLLATIIANMHFVFATFILILFEKWVTNMPF